MIDLETLGLQYNAAIISIGAVQFDISTGEMITKFHQNIEWASALQYGDADPDTVAWWSKQSTAAKYGLEHPKQRPSDEVFNEFAEFLGDDPIVWGNPSTFDISKLEYRFLHINPWEFWNIRDVMTYKQLGDELCNYDARKIPFEGTKHNAMDDAVHAAKYVSEIYQRIAEYKEKATRFDLSPER
jgi:DNA polymerase III epsilon subunit-like protein